MNALKRIFDALMAFLSPEKIPEFAASMYINLAKGTKTRFYQETAKEITERIGKRGDVFNILDIGTGPGFMLFEIADLMPHKILEVGIDLSKRMIGFARKEAKKRNCINIFFEIGNANNLRFEDNSCDFIISSGVLHSLRHPDKAIREWLRVLKSGHDLWIYDPTVLINGEESSDSLYLKKILDGMEKSLAGWKDRLIFRLMRWISNLPPHPMSIEDIYEIIQKADINYLVNIENRGDYIKIEIIKTVPFRIIE